MTTNQNLLDPLLTDEQLATELHVLPRTIRDWRNRCGLPFIRITNKTVRFRRSDVDAWLAKFRTAITA